MQLSSLSLALTRARRDLHAALQLTFLTSPTLDPRITFTRASSGTHFDSTGRLVTDGNNVARFDYDPATLLPRGLLIEEQRTNLLLHSRDMTQAAWSKTDVTAARTQVGIDGVASSACLITEGSAGTAQTTQTGTVAAGSTITVSHVMKRGNTDWIRIVAADATLTDGANAYFNLNTGVKGVVSARGAGTNNSSTITALGGGWYRCAVTTTPNGVYTSANNLIASAAADGSATRVANATYIVDCAQLEVGAFATSPIITGAGAATRAQSINSSTAVIPGAVGSVVVEAIASIGLPTGSQTLWYLDDGTASNRIQIYRFSDGTVRFRVDVGGAPQCDIVIGTVSNGTTFKIAASWSANDFAVSLNGGAVGTDVVGTIPTVTNRRLGMTHSNATPWNSTIKSVREYNSRLPDATLRSLTA